MADKFAPPTTCPKCGGKMEEGLVMSYQNISAKHVSADFVSEAGNGHRQTWRKAVPGIGKLFGKSFEGFIFSGDSFSVISYRCEDCSYLEAYAPVAFK